MCNRQLTTFNFFFIFCLAIYIALSMFASQPTTRSHTMSTQIKHHTLEIVMTTGHDGIYARSAARVYMPSRELTAAFYNYLAQRTHRSYLPCGGIKYDAHGDRYIEVRQNRAAKYRGALFYTDLHADVWRGYIHAMDIYTHRP